MMKTTPLGMRDIRITGGFWARKQQINRETTIQTEYRQCKETGRLDAWKLTWKPGEPNPPHIFWDSDVAKLVEAAGYSLAHYPDASLEAAMDALIADMARAQRPDGYLNTHYMSVEPEKRWSNLRDCHELYCAGHLMEAAVAYYRGTGKRQMLDVLCRYAEHIRSVFGTEEGKLRGYPGHEEIELALVKLYEASGERSYLELAKYFVDERGRQPHYFDTERARRGETRPFELGKADIMPYAFNQSHLPVREQTTAEGHAVRACYLYAGMAAVARETGDEELADACRRLWKNITRRRMYVTGGIGSSRFGERFTFDYDLPNEEAYAETCAAISLCFFAHEMLRMEPDGEYADIFERALYNGVLSGLSESGTQFFYDNVLASYPPYYRYAGQKSPRRQDWFGCSCCPPNIARLIASLNQYLYSTDGETLYVHHYVTSEAQCTLGGALFRVTQETSYPWDGDIRLTVSPCAGPSEATVSFRVPGWCRGAEVRLNGEALAMPESVRGYASIRRVWTAGDRIDLLFPMPVERVYSHPSVRQNAGKVALMRGPVVFCFEECDNGPLADLHLPPVSPLALEKAPSELGDVPAIRAFGLRRDVSGWEEKLYDTQQQHFTGADLLAVPYFLWANREPGSMTVWLTE